MHVLYKLHKVKVINSNITIKIWNWTTVVTTFFFLIELFSVDCLTTFQIKESSIIN